jgi:hypothetical protein
MVTNFLAYPDIRVQVTAQNAWNKIRAALNEKTP